ncbi:hypothetical protein [Noviluteimonas gilva]|uniref:Uncharacterized protein n=1 Tax=Noviluteimonas gilva TaxID=2682097 RepID=A0A7C9I4A9_9GAMM|nr:hypothetical protein [Lysobacter gilvus]MUV13569.1 hypothetical protein [Lysobacter gilvus]
MGKEVEKIIADLRAVYRNKADDGPDFDARAGAWWWGQTDDEFAYAVGSADLVSSDPVAKHLYLFSRAGDLAGAQAIASVISWCHGTAAEAASTAGGPRGRPQVVLDRESRWWRQAGQDGAALAMWGEASWWGDAFREAIPGINKRCAKYRCGSQAYGRVREYVEREAKSLIDNFKHDLESVLVGRYDPGFRARWELRTGTTFAEVSI